MWSNAPCRPQQRAKQVDTVNKPTCDATSRRRARRRTAADAVVDQPTRAALLRTASLSNNPLSPGNAGDGSRRRATSRALTQAWAVLCRARQAAPWLAAQERS
jgi:hypothetical protein